MGLGLGLDLMKFLRLGADQHQRLLMYLGLDLDLGLAGPGSDLARGRAVRGWRLGRFGSDPEDPMRVKFGLVRVSLPDLVAAFLRSAGLIEHGGPVFAGNGDRASAADRREAPGGADPNKAGNFGRLQRCTPSG